MVDVRLSVVQKGLGGGVIEGSGAVRHVHVTVPAPLSHHVPPHVYRAEDNRAPLPVSAVTATLAALSTSADDANANADADGDADGDGDADADGAPMPTFSGHPQQPSPKPRLRMKSVVFQRELERRDLVGGLAPRAMPPEFKGHFEGLATASGRQVIWPAWTPLVARIQANQPFLTRQVLRVSCFGPPGNASCVRKASHIQAHQPSLTRQGPTGAEWRSDEWSNNTAPPGVGFLGGGAAVPARRRQSTAAAEAEKTFTPGRSRAEHRNKSSFFKKGAQAHVATARAAGAARSLSPDGSLEEGSAMTDLQSYRYGLGPAHGATYGHAADGGYSVNSGSGPAPLPAVSEDGRAALMAMTRGKIASHYGPSNLSMEYSRTLNAKHRRSLILDTTY